MDHFNSVLKHKTSFVSQRSVLRVGMFIVRFIIPLATARIKTQRLTAISSKQESTTSRYVVCCRCIRENSFLSVLIVADIGPLGGPKSRELSRTMKASLVGYPTMARLKEAICDGRMYQTRHLLESGVDVNFLDEQGLTPLMRAAQLPDEKSRTRHNLLKLLLQYGANVNIVDQKGRHVLSRACIDEKVDIVRLLSNVANQDVDLNLRDFEGNTPLMHSVRAGNAALVKFLVDELNKFQVDIDIRNHEDRTPYLEAKRLGYEECAVILLKEGNASPNIQVNPFLDFMPLKDEAALRGRVRGVEDSKYRISSFDEKKHLNPREIQKKKIPTKKNANFYDEKSVTYHEKILKRKTTSPRRISSATLAKDADAKCKGPEKLRPTRRRKLAWHGRYMTEPISHTEEENAKENELITTESGEATGGVESVTGVRSPQQDKTSFMEKQGLTTSSRQEMTSLNDTISSIEITRADKHRQSPKITPKLHANSASSVGRKLTESRPELAMTRKHLRSHSLVTIKSKDAMDDNFSWYSHFSVYNSPSVAFLTKIMTIYAEQMSPESSFRFGVNPEKTTKKPDEAMVPKISVAGTETGDDLRSEGDRSPPLRSSLSSRNSSPAGSVSNPRRFQSAVTRTVASYLTGPKRSLSTLKVQDVDF